MKMLIVLCVLAAAMSGYQSTDLSEESLVPDEIVFAVVHTGVKGHIFCKVLTIKGIQFIKIDYVAQCH